MAYYVNTAAGLISLTKKKCFRGRKMMKTEKNSTRLDFSVKIYSNPQPLEKLILIAELVFQV